MPILSEEDLERFRTKVCTLASSLRCDFGIERCNYSHNLYWARRCPFYLRDSSILRYIPACCPDVELGPGSAVLKNTCPRGNNCSFAHSLEEMNYHPLIYKTELCKEYRVGRCKTYYCHMVHGLAEFRVPRDYLLPRKRGLQIPVYSHVTIVDNIRNIQGGSGSSGQGKEKNRHQQDYDTPKKAQQQSLVQQPVNSSKQPAQQSRNAPQKPRADQRKLEPVVSIHSLPEKPDFTDMFEGITWGHGLVEFDNKKGADPVVNGLKMDNATLSGGSHAGDDNSKKVADLHNRAKLNDRIGEFSGSDTESTTPWYGKGIDAPNPPNYTFSSFDSIFQESLKALQRTSSETASGESLSKINSMLTSDEVLADCVNVVRNVDDWKQIPPLPPSLSLQRTSDDEQVVESAASKDSNASLLDYVYTTVSQHCNAIAEKCVHTSNDRANLNLICKEAHNLWQLIVSIQSLLYDSASVYTDEDGSKSDCEGLDGQWSSLGSFYSELLEAYESESVKTTGSNVTANGVRVSSFTGATREGNIR